jgi:release factor glutamine methyltransferase
MSLNAWLPAVWRRTKIDAGEWLAQARQKLLTHSQQPLSEAQTLLGFVLGKPRAYILAHPETILSEGQAARLEDLLDRGAAGEPLPYLLSQWEFFGLKFIVTPAVLIPRPETELLVEEALDWLRDHPSRRRAADVGTGSGCIAISLANHIPDLVVTATDSSAQALTIAQKNTGAYGLLSRVHLVQTNLIAGVSGPFDLICANLPYIPTATLAGLDVARYEPKMALDGGIQGLDLISRLLTGAFHVLSLPALILLEIEAGQGESASMLARQFFPSASVTVLPDLAGLPRLLKVYVSE